MQGWLDQYDESSMIPHIFLSQQGYPGKWAHLLPEGRDISVQELLAHMDRTFGNVHNYNTMKQSLYEIRQKDSETIKEYMLIHEAVAMIRYTYPEWIPDQGMNLTRDWFCQGLLPSLHDSLSFAMADLPEHEQANTSFDTLYTLAKKLEARQPPCSHKGGQGSSEAYRDRFRRYPAPTGRVATLEEEELFPPYPETRDSELPELNQIEGLNMWMTQAMNHYQ